MRYTTRPVLVALLAVVMGSYGFAEETKTPWWHFGRSQDTPNAEEGVAPNSTITPVEEESRFAWPSLPKLSWFGSGAADETTTTDPFSTSPPVAAEATSHQPHTYFGKPIDRARPRNTWAQQPVAATPAVAGVSPWRSMTDGTRNAWRKTVDFVTPGESSAAPAVASDTRPSLWRRMWGAEEHDEGPRTVTEWMAQDRLDP